MIKIEERYNFYSVDKKIIEANSNIERNISKIPKNDRGFLSQNLFYHIYFINDYNSFLHSNKYFIRYPYKKESAIALQNKAIRALTAKQKSLQMI